MSIIRKGVPKNVTLGDNVNPDPPDSKKFNPKSGSITAVEFAVSSSKQSTDTAAVFSTADAASATMEQISTDAAAASSTADPLLDKADSNCNMAIKKLNSCAVSLPQYHITAGITTI